MFKGIEKSKIFKDAKKKAAKDKQKSEDDKEYNIKKNKEMNYTKGKSAKQALEFTLKAVNDDIRDYNIQVLNLLKVGMKKSQFTKFKVPKPKYNCKTRELKNIIDYDPKSYYYNMAVVLDCTFENLQYSVGGKGGGDVPYIDPALFTEILNQIFNTEIADENTRTVDGYIANLRAIQDIINNSRSELNQVLNRFTTYRKPFPEDEKMPELETDPDNTGARGEFFETRYSPREILEKIFFNKKFLDQNPFNLSENVIRYLREFGLGSRTRTYRDIINNFVNSLLGFIIGQDSEFESRVNDFIKQYKEKYKKNPSSRYLTTFIINYIKILLGIELSDIKGKNRDDQEWFNNYMNKVIKIKLPSRYYEIIKDMFLVFLSDVIPHLKDQIDIKVPERNKDEYNVDKPVGEVALETIMTDIQNEFIDNGLVLSTQELEQLYKNIIDIIVLAQNVGLNTYEELASKIMEEVRYMSNFKKTDVNNKEITGEKYKSSMKSYFLSRSFRRDVASFLKTILNGKAGIARDLIDTFNDMLDDLSIVSIDTIDQSREEKVNEEFKFDNQGNLALPKDRDESAPLGLNNQVQNDESAPLGLNNQVQNLEGDDQLNKRLIEEFEEAPPPDQEGVDIDINNIADNPPTQQVVIVNTDDLEEFGSRGSRGSRRSSLEISLSNPSSSRSSVPSELEEGDDETDYSTSSSSENDEYNKKIKLLKLLQIKHGFSNEEFVKIIQFIRIEDLQKLVDNYNKKDVEKLIKDINQEIRILEDSDEEVKVEDVIDEAESILNNPIVERRIKKMEEALKKKTTSENSRFIRTVFNNEINNIRNRLSAISRNRLRNIFNNFLATNGIPTNIRPATFTRLGNQFPPELRGMIFNYDNLWSDIWLTYFTIAIAGRRFTEALISGPNNINYRGHVLEMARFMDESVRGGFVLDEEPLPTITREEYENWFRDNIFRYVGFRYNRIRRIERFTPADPNEEDIDLDNRRYDPPDDDDLGDDIGDPGDDPDDYDDPGDPDDPDNNDRFEIDPSSRRRVGLKLKSLLRFMLLAILAGVTGVTIEELIKTAKADNDADKKKKPLPVNPKNPDEPKKPNEPKKPDDTKKPDDGSKFSKINHSELFDSVGLGSVIDFYNILVEQFNGDDVSPAQRKTIYNNIIDTYDKFAKVIGVPELKELQQARLDYDRLKEEFQRAKENGLSVASLMGIYTAMQSSARNLDYLTDKYMGIENGIFKGAFGVKSKEDADVTIDDHDADINLQTPQLRSKVDAKAKSIKGAILSKGMQERIARKMNRQGDFSNELLAEQRRFNDFSIIQQYEYPIGMGLDNPLQMHNKQMDIIRYKNPNQNPKPYKVPSYNQCVSKSKQLKPVFKNVIMIDNEPDDIYYNPMSNKLHDPYMHTSNINEEFHKSSLYNPEYTLQQVFKNRKAKDTITHGDWIRGGAYTYVSPVKHNPAYQYGQIEHKYNEKLNEYPLTFDNSDLEKGTEIKKVNSKLKRNRNIPMSFSLK